MVNTLSADTSIDAGRALVDLTRRSPVSARLARASELTTALRALALADLRRSNPDAGEGELRLLLAARLLPRELFTRAYGSNQEGA